MEARDPDGEAARSVGIPARSVELPGDLTVPAGALGTVVFAHGSGSSRLSPRNLEVARSLNGAGLATLLFDLLTEAEASDRRLVFDIDLLADRLEAALSWVCRQSSVAALPVGLFGASTGAAAALVAAADLGDAVAAVVSRGGRPDLAGARLVEVTAPTLLIVGGRDDVVLELNRAAQQQLQCRSALEVVPEATHLFEEPGALEVVARLTIQWFVSTF
jgi:putative phosphoribosyl transferase